jgi:hypothetical protein
MPKFSLSWVKSLGFDFEAEVHKFVQAKKDHLKTEGVPAPAAHPAVEAAVRRIPGSKTQPDDFVADYEILDDMPPPPTLDEKKAALAQQYLGQAVAMVEGITPPLKKRMMGFQLSDAHARKAAGTATDSDDAIIAQHQDLSKKHDAIWRHLAQIESQIDDLTADQIDVWKATPFPAV